MSSVEYRETSFHQNFRNQNALVMVYFIPIRKPHCLIIQNEKLLNKVIIIKLDYSRQLFQEY